MSRPLTKARGGIALVMVLLVLAALVTVALPFATTMRLQERSARGFEAQLRAEQLAEAGREAAVGQLLASHASEERRTAIQSGALADSPEDWDDLAELDVQLQDMAGKETFEVGNPQGQVVSVRVEDEQGKLNLNYAPTHALGALIGCAQLTSKVEEADTYLPVENVTNLFSDGDPKTLDGLLIVDAELIAYRHIEGDRIEGLERGAMFSAPRVEYLRHAEGAFVYDARALKLRLHPLWRELGAYHPFTTVSAARDIARWHLADFFAALLLKRGYSAEDLRDLGLGGASLERLKEAETWQRSLAPVSVSKTAELALPENLDKVKPEAIGRMADRALRRMGRQAGRQWVEDLARKLGQQGGRAADYAASLNERLATREKYEQSYFSSQGQQAAILREARDLEVLGARELNRLRPYLTVWSGSAGSWVGGALVVTDVVPKIDETTTTLQLGVDMHQASSGAIAKVIWRVDEVVRRIEYRRVEGVSRSNQRITLWPQLSQDYLTSVGELRVYVNPVQAININTAPTSVLRAAFSGVHFRPPGSRVSIVEAEAVAVRVAQSPVKDLGEWRTLLGSAVNADEVSAMGATALFVMAIDPTHSELRSAAMGLCFRSGEIYQIETAAAVHDPAGIPRARVRLRDVVALAPPQSDVVVHFDSQNDLNVGLPWPFAQGARAATLRMRKASARGYLMDTLPQAEIVVAGVGGGWLSRSHEPGVGTLRLATSEVVEYVGTKGGFEHFRDEPEGKRLDGSGHTESNLPTQPEWYLSDTWPEILAPGLVELWVKIDDPSAGAVIFDMGQRDETDRIVLTYGGSAQPELVFEAWDAGISNQVCARLRATWSPVAETWYHIAACWKGTKPDDIALFIDGLSVGTPEAIGYLTAKLDAVGNTVSVSSTVGFPATGALQVGTEVVEYDRKTATSFHVVDQRTPAQLVPQGQGSIPPATGRGVRGSAPRAHDVGTPVRVWGFTGFFLQSFPAQIPILAGNTFPIHRGGSTLAFPLPAKVPCTTLEPTGGALVLIPNDATVIPTAVGGPTLDSLGFPPRGFLQIKHEVLYYDQLQPHGFAGCVRRVYGWFDNDVVQVLDPTTGNMVDQEGYAMYTPAFLGSIEVVDATDYPDFPLPSDLLYGLGGFWVSIGGEWFRYVKAASAPNADPRWQNILICLDTAFGMGSGPGRLLGGGGTNAVTPNRGRWARADGWQQDGTTFYNTLLADLQASLGGVFPAPNIPTHIHYGMHWARNLWRAHGSATAHAAGEKVLPVYPLTRPYCGPGDELTLFDLQKTDPQRAAVTIDRTPQPNWSAGDNSLVLLSSRKIDLPLWLVSFTDFIPDRPYDPATIRVVKRPSGELPLWVPQTLSIGILRSGGEEPAQPFPSLTGFIDEVRLATDDWNMAYNPDKHLAMLRGSSSKAVMRREPTPVLRGESYAHQATFGTNLLGAPIGPVRVGARIAGPWLPAAGALDKAPWTLLANGEVMAWSGRSTVDVVPSPQRGLLATQVASHSTESTFYVLPFPPAAKLKGGFAGERGIRLPIAGLFPSASAVGQQGYLALDGENGAGILELLPFEERHSTYVRLPRSDRRRGAFRGAFGTADNSLVSQDRVAFVFPFRHFDRYTPRVESDEGTFAQYTWAVPGGETAEACWFKALSWDVQPARSADVGVEIFARIDNEGAWDAKPTNAPGGLYHFTDPQNATIEAPGRMIEVRVVMPFKPGAYARGAWKDSPKLDAVRIHTIVPIRVLSTEPGH